MSEIIGYIISFVVAYLLSLAIVLLFLLIEDRKREKKMSNSPRTAKNRRAARIQSQDEVSAQVDKIHEDMDEIHEDINEIHESIDEIHESIDEIGKSLDRMNESMDRAIEFKRLMRDYSNYKIKMIEARENFREPEFSDEKNIH